MVKEPKTRIFGITNFMTQSSNNSGHTKLSRRSFAQILLGAAALGLVEGSAITKVFAESKRSLSWLSSQTASAEGVWNDLKVEGVVPKELSGTLFRTAPGQSDNYGTPLKHLFDGDAYLSAWDFQNGKAALQTRFLPTPQRLDEMQNAQMLYDEYGTAAPRSAIKKKFAGKNQPSVNVIEWNGKLLGLSEGGAPTIINPRTFAYEGEHDFGGSLSKQLTFTAHPRFDPLTGEMFAYGFEKNASGTMHVFRINPKTDQAVEIFKSVQGGFFMAHDSMLTENYFLIPVPPLKYDLGALMTGQAEVIADALRYAENEPTRLYVIPRKSNTETAFTIDLPAALGFHYGNAYETADGKIAYSAILGKDKQLLEILANWKRNFYPSNASLENSQTLQQITIDIKRRTFVGTTDVLENVELPRYDARLTGRNSRFLYVVENNFRENSAIVKLNLQQGVSMKVQAGKTETYGEPVYTPRPNRTNEDDGYLVIQGFDAVRNETFLDIRDAQTLDRAARIWAAGQHFPLGFHGNFYPRF
jgi:all-trans-8'-apo-beta-carotenal 15,15'-oxygenase